jgi:hypothetical protein
VDEARCRIRMADILHGGARHAQGTIVVTM